MKLLVGLGNPGTGYAHHRHNVGFMALDAIHQHYQANAWQKKCHGLLANLTIVGEKAILIKPQTFMNLSGQAVQAAATFYKILPADIIVFHDELELPAGKIRVKQGGGAAGHNGLKSIDSVMGQNYWRVRLGIGRPPAGREAVHDYVLHNFTAPEQLWLTPLLKTLASELPLLLGGKMSEYMNRATIVLDGIE